MKLSFKILPILAVLFLVYSCGHFLNEKSDRNIASEVDIPYSVDDFLIIKKSRITIEEPDALNKMLKKFSNYKYIKIEDNSLPKDVALKIEPALHENELVIKIYHTKEAINDKFAIQEASKLFDTFIPSYGTRTNTIYASHHSIFELYYNAKKKDLNSLITLAKLRSFAFIDPEQIKPKSTIAVTKENLDFFNEFKSDKDEWDIIIKDLEKINKANVKAQKAQTEIRKSVMNALDKATDDQQLRSLVAKNDRKGVAKLIREYLPWELMPPLEKQFWETHLKIMSDPVPLDQRVLLYRGIDEDPIYIAESLAKKLSLDEAILDKKVFLMSTLLTKNQGTWNRRLRSLTAMYEKFITQGNNETNESTPAARISTMFKNHSAKAEGSPFLSFTSDYPIAARFGSKRSTAYLIDPRMVYYNFASPLTHEFEFLIPLITFPEDLVAVVDKDLHEIKHSGLAYPTLHNQIQKTLKEIYGEAQGATHYKEIMKRSEQYFANTTKSDSSKPVVLSAAEIDLYKKLYASDSKAAAKILEANPDIQCTSLMHAFFGH